jgi:hypothetical protein
MTPARPGPGTTTPGHAGQAPAWRGLRGRGSWVSFAVFGAGAALITAILTTATGGRTLDAGLTIAAITACGAIFNLMVRRHYRRHYEQVFADAACALALVTITSHGGRVQATAGRYTYTIVIPPDSPACITSRRSRFRRNRLHVGATPEQDTALRQHMARTAST